MFLCSVQTNLQVPLNQKYRGFRVKKQKCLCVGAPHGELCPSRWHLHEARRTFKGGDEEYSLFPPKLGEKWPKTDFPATLPSQPTMASSRESPPHTPGCHVPLTGQGFSSITKRAPEITLLTFLLLPQPPPSLTTSQWKRILTHISVFFVLILLDKLTRWIFIWDLM